MIAIINENTLIKFYLEKLEELIIPDYLEYYRYCTMKQYLND